MDHHHFLEQALEEAQLAEAEDEDPVGCVITDAQGVVLARAHNHINQWNDPTAHAEVRAIRMAIPRMGEDAARDWTLYSTLEPCPMCLGMILVCHIGTLVWAANDEHTQTYRLSLAEMYRAAQQLVIVARPYADLEAESLALHKAYWIARERTEGTRDSEESADEQD